MLSLKMITCRSCYTRTEVFMAVDIKVMVIWDVTSYSLTDETNVLEYVSASNSIKDPEDGGSRLFRNIGKPRATSDGIRPSKRKWGIPHHYQMISAQSRAAD